MSSILELEEIFDSRLARPRVTSHESAAMQVAATRWSEAVWAAAELAGPLQLSGIQSGRGVRIAHNSIHVCGVHRSGTTLVRDLLDSHPALAVLPSEGTFFTNMKRHLRRRPAKMWQRYVGCEWLRRLANPIHQAPYWLLGRSNAGGSPYLEFARSLMAWWPLVRQSCGTQTSSWPLTSVALAYAQCAGGLQEDSRTVFWAEKTPTNERFIDSLRKEIPGAKVIHVIRHPFAVYASHKQAMRDAGERFSNAGRILEDLNQSYQIAAQTKPGSRYHLIRYEDLTAAPRACTDLLARFLEIEALPILLQPTAAGFRTFSNSSFDAENRGRRLITANHEKWRSVLTRNDQDRISALVGKAAALVGYELGPIARWRARLWRASAPIVRRWS